MNERAEQGRVAVVVMAKEARPGHVKTRLSEALSPRESARLYAAMLADRCDWVTRVDGVVPAIAVAGWDGEGEVPGIVPDGFVSVPQPPGGLGAGLAAASAYFLDRGLPVVLVDSDSPTLPLRFLEEAVARVRDGRADVVIGPSEDGGYCLIGLGRPCPELFRDVPFSTDSVVTTTIERARSAGRSIHVLPAWWDVDTGADLHRLSAALFDAWWPERTADWLKRRALEARPIDRSAVVPEQDRFRTAFRRLASRAVYATPWLRIREDQVRMPDGRESTYTVVETGECVGVLPFSDPETVMLVRQHRYVAGRLTWEMPTGGVHPGEAPEVAAHRELAEEAGVEAGRLTRICSYHTSKSVMDETAHLFVAHDLRPAVAAADDTEFIAAERVPLARALAMVDAGEITDSMTIIALLHVARATG